MKVLLVNDYAITKGGANIDLLALRDWLRQRGHDARLFATYARSDRGCTLADYECFGTTSRFRTLLQKANPWAFWVLHRVLGEFRPDVVHVRMFLGQLSPLILLLLKHWPSLYHIDIYEAICPLATKMLPDRNRCQYSAGMVCYRKRCLPLRAMLPQMLRMKLWQRWHEAFRLIVANSEAVRSRLVAEGIRPAEVIWNGIPIQPSRPPLSFPPTVAFAGRLVQEKGLDVLMKAFAKAVRQVPEARLLLAGEGPQSKLLNGLISNLGLSAKVFMLGHIPRPELEQHFAPAWVQAIPSIREETFGLVAAEAMMRGTAVVASSSGGLTEIVQNGQTGFLVPPGDINLLAEALIRILKDRDLAEQMGKSAREFALRHFAGEISVEKFIALYQNLCNSKFSPRSKRTLS
jgi:glycosyltransferase involved in cell wall biosynthesis